MSDCISREKLAKKATHYEIAGFKTAKVVLLKDVMEIPAAEVKPVVRGSWVNNQELTRFACSSKGMYQCSECKQWINVFQMSGEMNFCPNCGADMRGGELNG